MKFVPRVAVSLLLVSMFGIAAPKAIAADMTPAVSREQIDNAIGRLARTLDRDLAAGKLTSEEADNFRSAISQLEEEEAQYIAATGNLGAAMASRLQAVITRIGKKLEGVNHDRRVAITDLAAAEADMKADIEFATATGQLTPEGAAALVKELNSVLETQTAQTRNGFLSYSDELLLSYRLDRLGENYGRMLTAPQPAGSTADELASQVGNAMAASKLSPEQLSDLHKQSELLQLELAKAHSIKNADAQQHQLVYIASKYALLKAQLEQADTGKLIVVAPQERAMQIDSAIADALVSGNLTPAEAHELRAELQGTLNELGSGANLPIEKVTRAGLELERTASQLQRWLHNSETGWPGLDAYSAALKKRIEDSAAANRIAGDQLVKYNSEVDAVARGLAAARTAHGGRLNATDALDFSMQLERINIALHHDERDRNITVPNIDVLQQQLDKAIAEGINSGRLAADGSLLTERLNHLADLRSTYEKAPGGLDPRARLAIADSIEQMINQIEQEIHHDAQANLPLDMGLDRLGDAVSNAVANGYISIQRGAQYRDAVDTIYADLNSARKSETGLTAQKTIGIANDINLLTAQIQDELRESAVLSAGLRDQVSDTKLLIANAVADGRLPIATGNQLIAELNHQLALVDGPLREQGGLSHGEGLQVAFDIRRIKENFERQIRDRDIPIADIAQECQAIDMKLANALATGQLTTTQAQQYKSGLDGIIDGSTFFRETDGGLSMPESIVLGLEVQQLSNAINSALGKVAQNRDVDSREAELMNRIKQLATNGRLSAKDAANLTYELDRIEQTEAAFRVSDEGLNFAEALTLTQDLDRLGLKVDAMSKASLSTLQQPRSR